MDIGVYETDYLAQSHWHHFRYRDRRDDRASTAQRAEVHVAPFTDEDGDRVTPPRDVRLRHAGHRGRQPAPTTSARRARTSTRSRSTIAVEAERFHRRLVNACIRAHAQAEPLRPEQLHVAIIGAGATGVELAAELHNTTRTLVSYGLDRIDPDKDMRLILIEAADRILPALPQRLSDAAAKLLEKLDVSVRTSARVAEVLPERRAGSRAARSFRRSSSSGRPASRRPISSRTSTASRPTGSTSSSCCPRCRRRATTNIFAHRRLRRVPVARQGGRRRAAARAGRAPAGVAHGEADPRPAGRQAARAVALSRLRLAGLARRVLDRRQPDGRASPAATCGSKAGSRG